MSKFIGNKKASEILGVNRLTLYKWEEKGQLDTIRTPGGKRLYNVEKFLNKQSNDNSNNKLPFNIDKMKRNICYCRVSIRKMIYHVK